MFIYIFTYKCICTLLINLSIYLFVFTCVCVCRWRCVYCTRSSSHVKPLSQFWNGFTLALQHYGESEGH